MSHNSDINTTLWRQLIICAAAGLVPALTWECSGQAARAPTPTVYHWPEQLAWRVDYVSEAQRDRVPILKYAESKTTRLARREGQYLGEQDSVLKTSQRPGGPLLLVTYTPEDTLAFTVRLGTHGELTDMRLGCDPALPECAVALPSAVTMELRRIIPRLPVWEAPSGGGWQDTLTFDDAARPGGTRGTVISRYTGRRDTVIYGREYWMIGWRSLRQSYRQGAGAAGIVAETPVQEDGITLVDKRLLVPVFAIWAGAVAAPPELRAIGATASGFRGRAYLAGSPFDSAYAGH